MARKLPGRIVRSKTHSANKKRPSAPARKSAAKKKRTARLAAPPQPVGLPTMVTTPESRSGNKRGKSYTTGLRGMLQSFDDGSTVMCATEALSAERVGGFKKETIAGTHQVTQNDVTLVQQINYSYNGRILPDATLWSKMSAVAGVPVGFGIAWEQNGVASQYGKNDTGDEGTGSPDMGLVQTNSEILGGSVKISIMETVFGANWQTNPKRLTAMLDVFYKKRMVRVPLMDVGPAENLPSRAEVDLTWACDQFLGTKGQATVRYRILVSRLK